MEKSPELRIAEVIGLYYAIKERILYGFPFRWGTEEESVTARTGHCGSKAAALIYELRKRDYRCRYVVSHGVHIIPKFMIPKFLDMHIWVEVMLDDEWLVFDPSPDPVAARLIGDTEPGTHLCMPEWVTTMSEIPPWYHEVYNNWSVFPYKVLINACMGIYRTYVRICKRT